MDILRVFKQKIRGRKEVEDLNQNLDTILGQVKMVYARCKSEILRRKPSPISVN